MEGIMKKCCGLCPYSRVDTLFVQPSRAEDFAYSADNPYNDFVCHKTGVTLEDTFFEEDEGSIVRGEKSLTCMGFASLQHNINQNLGKDFKPDPNAFGDSWEMIEHHTEHHEN
jgi:hypothetical protein